jgi:hypothetical protein
LVACRPGQRAHPFVRFATVVQPGREWVLGTKSVIELNENDLAILRNVSHEVFPEIQSEKSTTEEVDVLSHDLHFPDHLKTNLRNGC